VTRITSARDARNDKSISCVTRWANCPLPEMRAATNRGAQLTKEAVRQYTRVDGGGNRIRLGKEHIMGNRDKRGREKKKPKKAVSKPVSSPVRPVVEYKPVVPPPPAPPSEIKS